MTFFFSGRAVVSKLGQACSHSLQRLRAVVKGSRLTEISSHLQNELSDVDCTTNREIIRALVQRIEIGQTIAVVLCLRTDTGARASSPLVAFVPGVNMPQNAMLEQTKVSPAAAP